MERTEPMGFQTGVGQRTALVTGSASDRGIGYATAQRYAQEGWAVALLDLDAAVVAEKAASIASQAASARRSSSVSASSRWRFAA